MTTKFFDLMCDVECMGKGEKAALVSLGCVFFDLKTQTMGPTFLRTINLATAVRDGGTMDPSTVIFWLRQGDAARHSVAYNGQDIRKVLQDFSDWIKETCRHEDVRPYGNSNSFDLPKIETAMERVGMKTPWHFINVRCFRTMRAMYPGVEYNTADKGTGAHNALVDAQFQVEHLFKIANRNKAKNA
jgi:hypothetical protein